MRSLLALGILLYASGAKAQDPKAIDALVTDLMKKRGVPGLSLAVVKEGKVVYAKGYGLADVENNVPATPDTVYEIGSVTKQFTAAIVMQLVEEGKVKLDEPARTYLATMPETWSGVTVRHLLTHTSGIRSYTSIAAFGDAMRDPLSDGQFMALVGPEKIEFKPGEQWKYNNSGYFLLGLLIEKVTGKTYEQALNERIFKPLGMTASGVGDPEAIVKNRARGYAVSPGKGVRNAPYIDMGWPYAAGAIISTVKDLAKWDAALYSDKPVKQSSWKEAWTPVKFNDGKTFDYGFGWALGKINEVPIVEHGGDIPGFNAQILRVPSKKLTVIALCNTDPGIAGPVARGVAGIIDRALKVEIKPIPDTEPKTTAAHKALLADFANGTVKKEIFTEEMQSRIFPDLAASAKGFLTQLGPVKSFVLIKTEEKSGVKIRVYRVSYAAQDLNLLVATTKEGKITGFSLTPG
jgi:D-alanyl-D-alanine carboxypeptidase